MLIVLEVRGLTMEMVRRGDSAAHLFDLIAEGDLAECEGLPRRVDAEWIVDTRLERGLHELAAIDALIPALRQRGALAIVSERVAVFPRPLGLKPGSRLTSEQAAAHLEAIAGGP